MHDERTAVADVLTTYARALNASQTDEIVRLYAPDGVFMPQHFASSVGIDAVRRTYETVFATIRLSVRFEIAEIHTIGADWAFARTNSAGTTTTLATGARGEESNQELFVLQRTSGEWKIARYCFCTTNPPR